jgi:SAM-dependent methyltransferase
VVDLGCGRGVECFIAARLVGARGRVVGIDMLEPMLAVARRGAQAVAGRLGFANLAFHQGYLEQLPLESATMDAVLSNCVMNLSPHKRRAFAEILRVLRPGGRLVIADVVCEREPDAAIRNDETLRGECIAGALTQRDLIGILEECGFGAIRLIKRFPYRTVAGHPFFSLTYEAVKPAAGQQVRVLARGPLTAFAPDGEPLAPGATAVLPLWQADLAGEQLFQLDGRGAVTNLDLGEGCGCALPPEADSPPAPPTERFVAGCMVCGSELHYLDREEQRRCHFCEQTFATQAICAKGHYVCDACHSRDARQVIESICLASDETDMLRLLERITAHPAFPANGPDYHALVPAVILTTYRNLGGRLAREAILTGIRRGAQVAGGSCAFWGVCGAATGVGIAFSLILQANPMQARARQTVQTAVQQVLAEIAALRAARCCRRDSFLALRKAARLSRSLLPVPLRAEAELDCRQWQGNTGCLGDRCPLGGRRVGRQR